MWIAKCSLCMVRTSTVPSSARRRVSGAHTRVRNLRTTKGASVSIVQGMKIVMSGLWPHLVSMHLEN